MNDLIYILKVCTEVVNILLSLELTVYLIAKSHDQSKGNKSARTETSTQLTFVSSLYSAFIGFFLCSVFGFFFYFLEVRFSYYYSDLTLLYVDTAVLFNNLKNLFFIFAILSFFIMIGPYFFNKTLIWLISIILICLLLTFWTPFWIFNILSYVFLPLALIPVWLFYAMIQITNKHFRTQIIALFLGFLTFLSAFLCMNTLQAKWINLLETIIPEVLTLVGTILLSYGFISIPSLNEIFAPAMLNELFLMKNDGKVFFHYIFQGSMKNEAEIMKNSPSSSEQSEEADMVASSIVGIDSLLREVSSGKGLVKKLVQQNINFLIEWNGDIVGILITKKDLTILREMLINIVKTTQTKNIPNPNLPNSPTFEEQNTLKLLVEQQFMQKIFNEKPGSILMHSLFNKK